MEVAFNVEHARGSDAPGVNATYCRGDLDARSSGGLSSWLWFSQRAVGGFGCFPRAPAVGLFRRGSGTSFASPVVSRPLVPRSRPLTAGFPRFLAASNTYSGPAEVEPSVGCWWGCRWV